MAVITTNQLGKTYEGGTEALVDLSLTVEAGEIFGLLGPNGSGKSTTVRLLNGTLAPTTGTAEVLGLPGGDEGVRAATATVAELARLYEHMTVADNLRFFADLYGVERRAVDPRVEDLLALLGINDRGDDRLGSLSTGLKKRVQIARALLHRPRLLFLDEPTSGLDPESARDVISLVRDLALQDGATVFLCTHNLALAERICTSYGFLVEGSMVWSGTRTKLERETMPQKEVRIVTDRGEQTVRVDTDAHINAAVRRVMDEGAHILEVRQVQPSLEEAYFTIVKGEGGRDESVAS